LPKKHRDRKTAAGKKPRAESKSGTRCKDAKVPALGRENWGGLKKKEGGGHEEWGESTKPVLKPVRRKRGKPHRGEKGDQPCRLPCKKNKTGRSNGGHVLVIKKPTSQRRSETKNEFPTQARMKLSHGQNKKKKAVGSGGG